jgi:hypothetical protein
VLVSQLCRYETLTSPAFLQWAERLRPAWDPDGTGVPVFVHRKMWEWLFIAQALDERDMLRPGRRGLGFGVGQEPLVALFASTGCELVATDLDPEEAAAAGWTDSGVEYAGSAEALNAFGLCDPGAFAERVRYRSLDMRRIPPELRGFDFTWSSCAFEHLGSLREGMRFVVRQMDCLRPGGVAVHTTEYNTSSNRATLRKGPTVLYRRRDIERLARRLRRAGHRVELDLSEGQRPEDRHVDVAPYTPTHLRVEVGSYAATSIGLVVERGGR